MVSQFNPHISVDCVIFGFIRDRLNVLLIHREHDRNGKKSHIVKLPGNLIIRGEPLHSSAIRTLTELTGLKNIFLKQFGVFDDPHRLEPEEDLQWLTDTTSMQIERVVTIAYYSLINPDHTEKHSPALLNEAKWVPVDKVPELIFDHNQIINEGLLALQKEFLTEPLCFKLLPVKFTLNHLQKIYEFILGFSLDNRNFRKRINRMNYIVPLHERQTGVSHKPAQLYSFDEEKFNELDVQHTGFIV